MEYVIFVAALGGIVGTIAKSKGRSFFLWWLYGTLIFIVAIVHVLIIQPNAEHAEREALASGGTKCPMCAEIVKGDAKVCRFCGFTYDEQLLKARAV